MDNPKNSIISLPLSVDGYRMTCYYDVEDGVTYVGAESARNLTKKSIEGVTPSMISGKEVYLLKEVVEHMKPKALKHFALHGLKKVVESTLSEGVKNPGERKLSSFDRLILQAMEEQKE